LITSFSTWTRSSNVVIASVFLSMLWRQQAGDRIPVGGGRNISYQSGPPSLLYNGHQVSFLGVIRPRRDVDLPLSSSAKVKERVQLYRYSPFVPSWPLIMWAFTINLFTNVH
jgi:hypothetical protein